MIEEMLGLFFHGLWELIKLLSKAFYHFLKKHHRYACLLPILLVAAYLRFSYVFSATGFLGIDKQDLQIVADLFHGNLALIGGLLPPGNITLGPFYAYLIALPLWILGIDPIGPAFMAGILSIATAYLLYGIGKQFFNLQAGLFAAGLYAVSPFVLSYSHLSWNVDVLSFFSLLLLWVLFNAAASARPFLYYVLAGFLLGICLQLHYVAIFLIALIIMYMIITEIIVKGKGFIVPLLLHLFELLSGFVICLLPFLYYEALKGFPNTKALGEYFFAIAQSTDFIHFLVSLPQMLFTLFARLIVHFPSADTVVYYSPIEVTMLGYFAIVLLVFSCLVLIFFARNKFVILVLLLWLFLGIASFSFFKNDIYDYHFSILYPVCFLLVGNLLATIFHLASQERVKMTRQLISQTAESQSYTMMPVDVTDNRKLALHVTFMGISIVLFFLIVLLNLSVLPYRQESKEKKAQIKDVSAFILTKVAKEPFNFAIIATPNTPADSYDKALKQLGNEPIRIQHLEIDPERKTLTEYLYVVCEGQCKPLESDLWDIRGFGKAAIIDHWDVQGVTVYKLVHLVEHN